VNATDQSVSDELADLLDRLRSMPAARVLDVATGTGSLVATLMEILAGEPAFVGIDLDSDAIAEAQARFSDRPASFRTMDATNLRFEDATFDLVTIRDALHNLDDRGTALQEMIRVLRPDGHLLVEEPCYGGPEGPALEATLAAFRWLAEAKRVLGRRGRVPFTPARLRDALVHPELRTIADVVTPLCLRDALAASAPPPLEEDAPEFWVAGIQSLSKKLREAEEVASSQVEELLEEGERLQERIHQHGTTPALYYVAIARRR